MKLDYLRKILKGVNQLHKIKLYAKVNYEKQRAAIWISHNYTRASLNLPTLAITNKRKTEDETALLKKAVKKRNEMEEGA
jgi:hypothetical protein